MTQLRFELRRASEEVSLRKRWIVMKRSLRIKGLNRQTLGAREKAAYRNSRAVPRINTDALAEKAKTCKLKLVKGIRHIGAVSSVEGVSNFVSDIRRHHSISITKMARLFTKNVAGCKSERMCITGETCPVAVFQTSFQGG